MKPSPLWIRALPTRWVVNLSTLGPVGYLGKAPGTLGTLAGLVWFTVLFYGLPSFWFILLAAATIYLAVLICGEGEARMAKVDPPEMILDEMVAVPLCFLGLQVNGWQPVLGGPHAWAVILLGFLLFRFFDVLKPLGIGGLQKYPGGLGVVADDVAAALVTCLCLHLIVAFTPLGG